MKFSKFIWLIAFSLPANKAYELSTLTGTQVMLLVASETGHVYTFATKKLQPMITSEAGKALVGFQSGGFVEPTNRSWLI